MSSAFKATAMAAKKGLEDNRRQRAATAVATLSPSDRLNDVRKRSASNPVPPNVMSGKVFGIKGMGRRRRSSKKTRRRKRS